MRKRSLIVKQANEIRDWRSIVDFYVENPRKHLPIPTPNRIYEACEKGDFYVIHDGTDPGKVLACAGSFEWTRGTNVAESSRPEADTQVYELTGALVTELGGVSPCTIHEMLVWLRTVGTTLTFGFGPSPLCFIAAAIDNNTSSVTNLERCRLERISSKPHWLSVDEKSWVSGNEASFYSLSSGAFQNHANALYNLMENKMVLIRTSKHDGVQEEFTIIFDIPWLIDQSFGLKALITGEGDESLANIVSPPKYSRTKGGLL